MSAANENANNFDSLRLILAVLVIFSHAFPLGRGSNASEPLFVLTHGLTTIGDLSVWGFFVISGFLITQSWLRAPTPLRFLKRRVGRIYPGFIVATLLSATIVVPLAATQPGYPFVSLGNFLFSTLRLLPYQTPPVFMKNAAPGVVNGSLWSIAFEFWCYVGVMLLGLTRLLRRRYLLLLLLAGTIGCHIYLDITGWRPGGKFLAAIFGYPGLWATVLPFFLAGMTFQLFGGPALVHLPAAMVAFAALVVSYFIPHGPVVSLPTCGAYCLLTLAYLPRLNALNLGRYGDFSYGVYLYAFPIEQLLVMAAGGSLSPLRLFALAAPLSIAAGALSWFCVERHFLSRPARKKHEGSAAVLVTQRTLKSPAG